MTEKELEHIRSHCPCGAPVALEQHVFGEGLLNGHGVPHKITKVYWAPKYHHDASGRWFCSASCSLQWHETFWRRVNEHTEVSRHHRAAA